MVPLHLDIENRLPEAVVDAHVKISDINSYSRMFTKCVGDFLFNPDEKEKEELLQMDPYKLGEYLCDMFRPCSIDEWFRPRLERSYTMGGHRLPSPAAAAAARKMEHLLQSIQKGYKIAQPSDLNEKDIYWFKYKVNIDDDNLIIDPFILVKYSRTASVLNDTETHIIFKRLDAPLLDPSYPVEIGGAWKEFDVYALEFQA